MASDNHSSESSQSDGDVQRQLMEQAAQITVLERQKQEQGEQLVLLQREMNETDVKHKEEIYWLQLELDAARREKEAAEDRMAELYRDLREMTEEGHEQLQSIQTPARTDPEYIVDLQERVDKYARTLGVLDNQLAMVKASCDDLVKSLKMEITDVVEEKCRMEMDLLNQLAVLDSEKRDVEIALEEHMKVKDKQLKSLMQNGTSAGSTELAEDLMQQVNMLTEQKKKLEDQLASTRNQSEDLIANLNDDILDRDNQIERLTRELEVMRQGLSAESLPAPAELARDRDEALDLLERVATIWERADDSIQGLEDVMDELRPNDKGDIKGDTERLLSTLEAASLLHGQIKVSLLLVELKLRNQLSALRNDTGSLRAVGADHDKEIVERMKEIQQEALSTLGQVDTGLTARIHQLELTTRNETAEMKKSLLAKTEELKSLQSTHAKLEREIATLKKVDESKSKTVDKKENGNTTVSREVLERLQNEVIKVVHRVKEKNDTIGRLNTCVEEHKVREQILKKELKRVMRKAKLGEEESVKSGKSGASGARRGVEMSNR